MILADHCLNRKCLVTGNAHRVFWIGNGSFFRVIHAVKEEYNLVQPNRLLRTARLNLCLSQKQLARELGVSEHSIYRWEMGMKPHPYHQEKICKILQLSPSDLGFVNNSVHVH